MSEWKPGDVAILFPPGIEYGIRGIRVNRFNLCKHTPGAHWHTTDGDYLGGTLGDDRARPLVVIDPEDREQVERLDLAMRMPLTMMGLPLVDRLQQALREFANPEPVTVFEHYPTPATRESVVTQSICGKVWKPNPDAVAVGKCPECADILAAGWVK